jgi:hypothetical protein
MGKLETYICILPSRHIVLARRWLSTDLATATWQNSQIGILIKSMMLNIGEGI